jgi:hypothetical protein
MVFGFVLLGEGEIYTNRIGHPRTGSFLEEAIRKHVT